MHEKMTTLILDYLTCLLSLCQPKVVTHIFAKNLFLCLNFRAVQTPVFSPPAENFKLVCKFVKIGIFYSLKWKHHLCFLFKNLTLRILGINILLFVICIMHGIFVLQNETHFLFWKNIKVLFKINGRADTPQTTIHALRNITTLAEVHVRNFPMLNHSRPTWCKTELVTFIQYTACMQQTKQQGKY